MRKNSIEAFDFVLLFLFGLIEQHEVLFTPVQVKAANGFAVVVVEQDGEVGLAIPVMNAAYRYHFPKDALYNIECIEKTLSTMT